MVSTTEPFCLLIAARPPFSVVFNWLSMMAPLGVASRPSLGPCQRKCRLCAISGSTTRQCPKEAGQIRQGMRQNVQYAVNHLPQV